MEAVAEGIDTLFGTRLFLIAACAAESSIKLILVQRIQQSLGLHQVRMHFAAVGERSHSCIEGFHVAFHNQIPAVLLGILVTELDHLFKLPLRIDVHQGERHLAGIERLFGKADHHRGVFAYTIKHHRVLKFRSHLTDDMNGLCFEFLQMAQFIFFHVYIITF